MAMEVSTGSMMSSCESKELNHLGLVAGMYESSGKFWGHKVLWTQYITSCFYVR